MDITATRRERLKLWFDARSIPAKEKSYISQLMGGSVAFGEKAARRIEQTYGMDTGYLDTAISAPDGDANNEELPAKDAVSSAKKAPLMLAYIDTDEMEIISDYRQSTALGKTLIKTTAKTAKKNPALKG